MSDATAICSPQEVLSFWFDELSPNAWFTADASLDAQCDRRFRLTHLAVSRHVEDAWRATPSARLATILLLDQISRNVFRGSPLAFATDGLALREARMAVDAGADLGMSVDQRAFFYLPFEHSENLKDQTDSVRLFSDLADPNYLDFAIRHCEVIRQFGRFPHRNAILGRVSTEAELAFLDQPGSSF
ncbi:uncharacterized protein (DUF924 family) [Pararhizobium capsulatum DSM 1112]|uniref:Uncharacterized protein (DUF924 family) n=1 Tax=Pararhizobium capsulatum DSM 1112 TaxID=1121113 RepID=A0ABU0BR52_9HYPH|nr:DUF924 family protein [Pararhizobium capsulatum]MDQ0320714.1 uncharacterized protein (DUF924 family) [Pararhizobium capsulatum DSM 1112]